MRITPQAATAVRTCAICERTLLVGERSVRYTPDGEGFVDVCPLCQEIALEHGWIKEGSPTTPVVADRRRRRRWIGTVGVVGLPSFTQPCSIAISWHSGHTST